MGEIARVFAERGDLAHLALFLWASGASGLLAWALKEIAASNRRFNDFVAEIARINKVLSLAHDDTAHHRPLPDVSALEDERRPPPRVL
ncbi:MAG: hypothetical protein KDJ77_14730 [Rhodobiaceae bacterium]|nr:hypothetical protein [Rhodobiaceae bacterium]